MTQDPHRLSDDPAEPELGRALREAQGDVLSPDAVARVRSALMVAGIAAAGGASVGSLGAGLRSPAAKLIAGAAGRRIGLMGLGLAGLGLAGVAGVFLMQHTASHSGAPVTQPDQTVETAGTAPILDDGGVTSRSAELHPRTAVEVPAASAEPPTPPAQPVASTSTFARPPLKPPAQPAAEATPSPREGALLLEARRALGADPARALTLVRAHELEFPRSQLGPERARIAAEAHRRLEK
jgi:hypothetical protein